MIESKRSGIERYLCSDTTILARGLRLISPKEGQSYRNSGIKRVVDVALSFPLAAAAVPVILALAIGRKIEDGQPAFFVQDRLGKNGRVFPMVKMMQEGIILTCSMPGKQIWV